MAVVARKKKRRINSDKSSTSEFEAEDLEKEAVEGRGFPDLK